MSRRNFLKGQGDYDLHHTTNWAQGNVHFAHHGDGVNWLRAGRTAFEHRPAQWATNGSNINNTNSGNVGIGTSSPGVRLDVQRSDGSDLVVRAWNAATASGAAVFRAAASSGGNEAARLELTDNTGYNTNMRGQSGQRVQVRVEQLTLRPTGFKPAEIRRAAGPIAFIVVNNTRLQDISLRLNDGIGNTLRVVRIAPGKREWREYINLPAGTYVISEGSHPDWTCRLIISAR